MNALHIGTTKNTPTGKPREGNSKKGRPVEEDTGKGR
jgi:hypothetical protein